MENNNKPSRQGLKIEVGKNDLIYAIIMILLIVLGFIGGTLVQMNSITNKCNLHFNEWINENCECSDNIKELKQSGMILDVDMIAPQFGEEKNETRGS